MAYLDPARGLPAASFGVSAPRPARRLPTHLGPVEREVVRAACRSTAFAGTRVSPAEGSAVQVPVQRQLAALHRYAALLHRGDDAAEAAGDRLLAEGFTDRQLAHVRAIVGRERNVRREEAPLALAFVAAAGVALFALLQFLIGEPGVDLVLAALAMLPLVPLASGPARRRS